MTDMGKEELLKWLSKWFQTIPYDEEERDVDNEAQAYAQLKAIVEEYFAEPQGVDEHIRLLGRIRGLIAKLPKDAEILFPIHEKFTDKECEQIAEIKQLLTRQPVQVDGELLEKIVQEVNTEMSRIDVDTNSKEVDYFTNEAKERVKQLLQQKRGDK